MAEHSAGHDFLPRSRGDDELKTHPETSAMEPQEECNPQGLTSHSAFTNESEPSHSALTNEPEPLRSAFTDEPEPAQTHDHVDAMIDSENTAGRRANYERCQECLRKHPPPCTASQEDKELLKRDPEAYKRHYNTEEEAESQEPPSLRTITTASPWNITSLVTRPRQPRTPRRPNWKTGHDTARSCCHSLCCLPSCDNNVRSCSPNGTVERGQSSSTPCSKRLGS